MASPDKPWLVLLKSMAPVYQDTSGDLLSNCPAGKGAFLAKALKAILC